MLAERESGRRRYVRAHTCVYVGGKVGVYAATDTPSATNAENACLWLRKKKKVSGEHQPKWYERSPLQTSLNPNSVQLYVFPPSRVLPRTARCQRSACLLLLYPSIHFLSPSVKRKRRDGTLFSAQPVVIIKTSEFPKHLISQRCKSRPFK